MVEAQAGRRDRAGGVWGEWGERGARTCQAGFVLGEGEKAPRTALDQLPACGATRPRSDFLQPRVGEDSDEGEGVDDIWQFLIIRKGKKNKPDTR